MLLQLDCGLTNQVVDQSLIDTLMSQASREVAARREVEQSWTSPRSNLSGELFFVLWRQFCVTHDKEYPLQP